MSKQELYRPQEEELLQSPEATQRDAEAFYKEQEPAPELPKDLTEAIENQQETIHRLCEEQFGSAEVPEELAREMSGVMEEIKKQVKEKGFVAEPDEKLTDRLRPLVVRIMEYKENPKNISIESVPEQGYWVTYEQADGTRVERLFSPDEQDVLFNLELWADQVNTFENVKMFREAVAHARVVTVGHPEKDQTTAVVGELAKRYTHFGFSRDQLEKLVLLGGPEGLDELRPEDASGELRKLEVMRQVWQEYMTGPERSEYVKLAAGLMTVGVAEGALPVLFKFMLDANDVPQAALFASSFCASHASLGWVRKFLTDKFEIFINDVTSRQGGLNDRLANDLAFQPGEKMAGAKERGRISAALRRSQEAFRGILTGVAQATVPSLAGVAAGVASIMALDWRLGSLALASAPITLAITRRTEKKIGKLIDETHENDEKLTTEIEEQISAHMEGVLAGMRDPMAARFGKIMAEKNRLMSERGEARNRMDFQSQSVLSPIMIGAMVFAGMIVHRLGIFESGKTIAAVVAAGNFRAAFDRIMRQNTYLMEEVRDIIEMEEVFNGYADEERTADEGRRPASELPDFGLKLQGVDLEFDGKKIIDGVSFEVPAGGVVRLDGLSGQGKTTLTKLMAGYYRPAAGEIRIGDHPVGDIKKTGPDSLYTRVGYLSQHPYVFDGVDLLENLKFGNQELDEDEARRVISELGLADRFSKGGAIDLKSSVVGLSGGERTRLGLARVLLKLRSQENGGIVFLDEPTEGLDAGTEAEIARILVREKAKHPKTTVVVVSHRQSFIDALGKPDGDAPGLDIQQVRIEKGKVVS